MYTKLLTKKLKSLILKETWTLSSYLESPYRDRIGHRYLWYFADLTIFHVSTSQPEENYTASSLQFHGRNTHSFLHSNFLICFPYPTLPDFVISAQYTLPVIIVPGLPYPYRKLASATTCCPGTQTAFDLT